MITKSCDVCNSKKSQEIKVLRKYSNKQEIRVCKKCGFIFVPNRRSYEEIAKTWSRKLYGNTYTARIPAIKARQTYLIDTLDNWFGLKNKDICDIGAGEGQMLEIADKEYGAKVFGIEPSKKNIFLMRKNKIKCFEGTIEDYHKSKNFNKKKFDIVTIAWTLENCSSCFDLINISKKLLKPSGKIVVATGSRILVPFKKPLSLYISKVEADTHSFRFSRNTLARLMIINGLNIVKENRYIDTDYLILSGRKSNKSKMNKRKLPKDNYKNILDFFKRWDKEQKYFL